MQTTLLTLFLLTLPQPEGSLTPTCEEIPVHFVLPTPGPYSRVTLAPSTDLDEHIMISVYSGQMVASSTTAQAKKDTVQILVVSYELRMKPGTMIEAGEESNSIMILSPHDEEKRLMLQGGPYALKDLPLLLQFIHPSHFGLGMIHTESKNNTTQFVLVLSPTYRQREVRTSKGQPPWGKEDPGWSRPDHPPQELVGAPAQFASLKQITGASPETLLMGMLTCVTSVKYVQLPQPK